MLLYLQKITVAVHNWQEQVKLKVILIIVRLICEYKIENHFTFIFYIKTSDTWKRNGRCDCLYAVCTAFWENVVLNTRLVEQAFDRKIKTM